MTHNLFTHTQLAASSQTLFNKKLTQFISLMPQSKQTITDLISNPEEAQNALNQSKTLTQTPANQHMFYSAVVAYLKHTEQGKTTPESIKTQWLILQKANWSKRTTQTNVPTENQTQVAQNVTWQDVINKRNTLTPGSPEHLLLSLYTYLPPVRADYFEVRLNPPTAIRDDPHSNYIQLETKTLVIRDFKTAKTYEEIKHTLPEPLYETLTQSLKQTPRNYLFVMPSDPTRPYDRGGFSKWANKVLSSLFNVSMTLTSLRHLFISTLDFNARSSELEKIGNAMGHSLSMQKGYQWIEE